MVSGFDAILIVSFGGPEKREDVIPFLENVLRGKPVPRERLLEVAEHYYHFDGVSPINAHIRELIGALRKELDGKGIFLPIFWGNRNWDPLLPDTLREMGEQGVRRALAFVTSAYSSYSSCRQYLEDIERARKSVGGTAPAVEKLRGFYNHPLFVEANVDRVRAALARLAPVERETARIAFTAHSIPQSMARQCDYERQLLETCRLVADAVGIGRDRYQLVYQSRSGRPTDPWLEPDILEHLRSVHEKGTRNSIVMPIGFLSDHMEVLYDLDVEARQLCDEIGFNMIRASTVGTHPLFVRMIRELIVERISAPGPRPALGQFAAPPDLCAADCCPAPLRPAAPPVSP